MHQRVNHAADEKRERPVKHTPQTAENAAAKQDFFQRGDNHRRHDGAENDSHDFVRRQILNQAPPAKSDGDAGDGGQ